MSNEEELPDFNIAKESIWLIPLEWGTIFSFLIIIMEYFVVVEMTETAAAAFYDYGFLAAFVVLILAIKEVRDKKLGGTIGYWKGVLIAVLTGLVIAIITAIWGYIMYPYDPEFGIEESIFIQMFSYTGFALIIGIAMKRN